MQGIGYKQAVHTIPTRLESFNGPSSFICNKILVYKRNKFPTSPSQREEHFPPAERVKLHRTARLMWGLYCMCLVSVQHMRSSLLTWTLNLSLSLSILCEYCVQLYCFSIFCTYNLDRVTRYLNLHLLYISSVCHCCLPVFIAAGGGDTSTASFVGSVIVKSNWSNHTRHTRKL
jgi:hypothetical protein